MGLLDHTAEITNETQYSLAFDLEVVILLEASLPTIRKEVYDDNNAEVLAWDLDLANERRENALVRLANYQKQLVKTYNQ